MRYVLKPDTLSKLDFLRKEYQDYKDLSLDTPPSFIALPTFLGGADVETRKAQITFLEKIRIFLKANTLKSEEITNPEEFFANLTASRVMLAAILYVRDQISKTYTVRSPKNSVLYDLLDTDLGVTPENYLDEEDKECCYLAAKRITMSSVSALEQANTALKEAGFTSIITESEWRKFQDFLCAQSITKISRDPYADYPITNISKRIFGAAGAYTGATIGMLSGDVISNSTKALSVKMQFTALIGSTLLVFGSAGPAGVAFIAPAIAQRLVSAFCSISLAHILGMSMGMLGQGVGIIVGVPLDLTYKLIRSTCTAIAAYAYSSPKPLLTGTRLVDGMTLICGIPIQLTPMDEVPSDALNVDIRGGELYINDVKVGADGPAVKLNEEALRRLKSKGMDFSIHEGKAELVLAEGVAEEDEADVALDPAATF